MKRKKKNWVGSFFSGPAEMLTDFFYLAYNNEVT